MDSTNSSPFRQNLLHRKFQKVVQKEMLRCLDNVKEVIYFIDIILDEHILYFRHLDINCEYYWNIHIFTKKLGCWHKSDFLIFISLQNQCCKSWIFQTMNSVRSHNLNLKYWRLTLSGCKDIEIKNVSLRHRLNSFTFYLISFPWPLICSILLLNFF